MQDENPRELRLELLGINGLDPFFSESSAARKAMMASHVGQSPIVKGNEPRRIFTGMEFEYAKEAFNVKFPCHATVLHVIRKYPVGNARDSIRENPVTTIIYEDYYCPFKTVGVLHVPNYESYHQDFGFPYVRNAKVWDRLNPGENFEAGEIIAASNAVKADGSYGLGVEAEVAFLSHPATIEDGLLMSESFLKKMTPTSYSTLIGSWGKKHFPLNLYGDEEIYKPFPDIGERIHPSGLAMAFRQIDPKLGIADMTPRALRTVDQAYDRPLWGKANAKVVDIKVYHDDRLNPSFTPVGMDTQARKYYDSLAHYYRTLMDIYERLKSRRRERLKITPEFTRLLVEAQLYLPVSGMKERKLTRMHRLEILDEWRVELTYEWEMPVGEGYKFTDWHGGKGVDCKTVPDDHMPVDENGNRADLVIYGISTINRTNGGRLFEQFFNAASRDLVQRIRREAGLNHLLTPTLHQVRQLTQDEAWTQATFERILGYYQKCVPWQYEDMLDHPNPRDHVERVLIEGIYLNHPPNNPKSPMNSVRDIIPSEYCPHYGPVTYKNGLGETVTTDKNVLIGSLYVMELEKTGEDWSAASSVKVQHFGVPAKLNQFDRQTAPARQSAVRGLGESETRSYVCTVGPEPTMDLLDQSNNPDSHRNATYNILTAEHPTNIASVVDRKKVPLGGSRPVGIAHHIMACRGLKFVYIPDEEG